jgi:PhoH-like ATPase
MLKRTGKRKNYILDTNVLMHDPWCFTNFIDNNVYIPVTVLEELDNLKTREGIAGYQAREAVRALHRTIDGNGKQCVNEGILLENGIILYVAFAQPCNDSGVIFESQKNDDLILSTAIKIKNTSKDLDTILVSKDVCLRIKAEVSGITSGLRNRQS